MAPWPVNIQELSGGSMVRWIKKLLSIASTTPLPPDQHHHFLLNAVNALDILWMYRCKLFYNELIPMPDVIAAQVNQIAREHVEAWKGDMTATCYSWIPPLKVC